MSWLIVGGMLGLSLGCQRPMHADYAAFVREPRPTHPGQDYRLGVGDIVQVTMTRGDDRLTRHVAIDAAGRIHLPGLRPMRAAGRGTQEVAQRLKVEAERLDQNQTYELRVQAFRSQKVFVFGQVDGAGPQVYHGANDVLGAVTEATPTARADLRRVLVLRPSPDGELRRRLTVDLEAVKQRGDTALNVVLAPGDIVYVPPTRLGSLGLAWEQLFPPSRAPETSVRPGGNETSGSSAEVQRFREQIGLAEGQIEDLQDQLRGLQDAVAAARLAAVTPQAKRRATARRTHAEVQFQSVPAGSGYTVHSNQRGGAGESTPPDGVRFWSP
jgi:protein involved in polysaccharide export with SLBB domain